jgi:hypothetical protein
MLRLSAVSSNPQTASRELRCQHALVLCRPPEIAAAASLFVAIADVRTAKTRLRGPRECCLGAELGFPDVA